MTEAGAGADFWVCGECRSINKLRAKQCYNCRTPRDIAAVDPANIDPSGHGRLREIALPAFHSSRLVAIVASVLILVVAGVQILATVQATQLANGVIDNPGAFLDPAGNFTAYGEAQFLGAGVLGVMSIVAALLALTAWAFWLSRVVRAMPALGLGYPAANGLMAFVENFVPVLNLLRVPAIVRDVVRRLEPEQGRGEALIFAAWIGLFGGYLFPRIWARVSVIEGGTLEEQVRQAILVEGAATGFVLVGAIFLVALIWRIEHGIDRRHAAQVAGEAPPEPRPALPIEARVDAVSFSPDRTAPVSTPPAAAVPAAAAPRVSFERAAVAPDATVPGPLGSIPAGSAVDDRLHRPITAATGAASIPALPTEPTEPPASTPVPAPAPQPTVLGHVAAGPRLQLRIESGTSMTATLDGESEPISIDELRAAAEALARVDGSAVVTTTSTTFEARALVQEAFEVLSNAGVPSAIED